MDRAFDNAFSCSYPNSHYGIELCREVRDKANISDRWTNLRVINQPTSEGKPSGPIVWSWYVSSLEKA